MEIVGSLIPTFVFKRRGKFDKFIHHIVLSDINIIHLIQHTSYNTPNQLV
jgi:hypothetical protein